MPSEASEEQKHQQREKNVCQTENLSDTQGGHEPAVGQAGRETTTSCLYSVSRESSTSGRNLNFISV